VTRQTDPTEYAHQSRLSCLYRTFLLERGLKRRLLLVSIPSVVLILLGLLTASLLLPTTAAAQEIDKAHQLLEKIMQALGGTAYRTVEDITQKGRVYDFTNGSLSGPGSKFKNYIRFPNKQWTEYGKKGNIVFLNAGEEGWELDKQGINEQTPEALESFVESFQRDYDYFLRFRVHDEDMQLYYLGREFIDNHPAYILELVDADGESYKLYVDAITNLPRQLHYRRYSALRGARVPFVEYFGKYINIQGVETPMHVSRERNGQRIMEVFFSDIQYNQNLSDEFFTRDNLEARWRKVK